MKEKKVDKIDQSIYVPLQKKTLKAALEYFFEEQCPQYGELARKAIVRHLQHLVDMFYPSNEFLRMGQVMWPAIDEKETSGYGKPIEKCKLKPVFLDLISDEDIQKLLHNEKKWKIRQGIAVRLFNHAKDQGAVLTNIDVATMLNVTPVTISKYIREYEKENGTLVPRRGTIHDIGPSITHKREICFKVIVKRKSVEDTARETNHSPEAVTRYVKDFKRIYTCLNNGFSVEDTAFTVKVSKNLVYEYVDIMKELEDIPF